tara:strand:- start:925 stop:1071 length:147 start_codon:yes stop_codon:yes gene_type:complete
MKQTNNTEIAEIAKFYQRIKNAKTEKDKTKKKSLIKRIKNYFKSNRLP